MMGASANGIPSVGTGCAKGQRVVVKQGFIERTGTSFFYSIYDTRNVVAQPVLVHSPIKLNHRSS
jgi:hypothetical protein